MDAQKFSLESFVGKDEYFHLARVTIHSRQDLSLHKHDYAEIFWIEKGSGFHHINGQSEPLNTGDLAMIRPEDRHTFSSTRRGITVMNLAFPSETLSYLRSRYFQKSDSYFWMEDSLPYRINLDRELLSRITPRAEEIYKFARSPLQLDSLILFIFHLISDHEKIMSNSEIPVWLNRAINQFPTSTLFREGPAGFAKLCEKNIDHVNRMTRKYFQKTLSEIVTELRMSFAARQLSITNTPIKTICTDCGFTNLGHFYKVFKRTYSQTPSEYRKIHQTIV